MTKIAYRPATHEDAQFVLEVEEVAMRAHAEALWGQWRPRSGLEDFDPARVEILLDGERQIGICAVNVKDNYLFVQRLYLLPEFQNRGFGARVLSDIRARAKSEGLPVQLTVLSSNASAKRFYEREGFAVISTTPERIRLEWSH